MTDIRYNGYDAVEEVSEGEDLVTNSATYEERQKAAYEITPPPTQRPITLLPPQQSTSQVAAVPIITSPVKKAAGGRPKAKGLKGKKPTKRMGLRKKLELLEEKLAKVSESSKRRSRRAPPVCSTSASSSSESEESIDSDSDSDMDMDKQHKRHSKKSNRRMVGGKKAMYSIREWTAIARQLASFGSNNNKQ